MQSSSDKYSYSECVCVCVCVALVIQHAKRLSRITRTLLSVASWLYHILPHYLKKGTTFEKKKKKVLNVKKRVWFPLKLMSEKVSF